MFIYFVRRAAPFRLSCLACLFCLAWLFCSSTAFAAEAPPLSPTVQAGNLIFVSGQVPVDASGALVPGGIKAQVKQVMNNLDATLRNSGSGIHKVVKTTVFLKDFNDFEAMNEVYRQYFPQRFPARSTVEVSRIAMDALVEIEAVATLK